MTTCAGCGMVYGDLPPGLVGTWLTAAAPRYRDLLTATPRPALRARPEAATWSALEYACHVRDVLLVQRDRALRALVEDVPSFPPMHREERVALARYADEDPDLLGQEVVMAAGLLSRLYDALEPHQLERCCVYGYPTPTEVDVAWMGRHTIHEVEHHLIDVHRVLSLTTGRDGL